VCNTALLGTYGSLHALSLVFTTVFIYYPHHLTITTTHTRKLLVIQVPSSIILILLILLELFSVNFNDEYAYIVPIALLLEEALTYRSGVSL